MAMISSAGESIFHSTRETREPFPQAMALIAGQLGIGASVLGRSPPCLHHSAAGAVRSEAADDLPAHFPTSGHWHLIMRL
jgi:hypothetical protein